MEVPVLDVTFVGLCYFVQETHPKLVDAVVPPEHAKQANHYDKHYSQNSENHIIIPAAPLTTPPLGQWASGPIRPLQSWHGGKD